MVVNSLRSRKRGFTLMELLIVIVIMGLLMSLVAPTMFSKVGASKAKTAEAQMQMIATALDVYRLDVGAYPSELERLRQDDKTGWDGPYLPKAIPLDPWNHSYIYKAPGENGALYNLRSLGSDGVEGGEGEAADVVYQ
ncbi:type II secretion system major pseudopilin GspG [Vibrio splendidus]|uniref:type II secretion system major pseudopilin GspG n=1 Tax=Vibrio splendidus TaxID=29497 RepID=UPI0022359019|nr:type II secretion system major pseudopilin GspG [Vibrio splendidus]MCW4446355.1 type II secretion system major pseudopilin GspG [Vibrio splendidus]